MRTSSIRPVMLAVALAGLLALLSSGCALHEYASYKRKPDFPADASGSLDLPGLSAPVTVFLDEAGIAHIRAQNEADLMRATGFFQARSRYFQMDMMRRIARGRVSELVGDQPLMASTTVAFDVSMRGWGFDRDVADDARRVDAETRALLDAYVEGINQAVRLYTPLEYRLLGCEPEPWTLEDSFALGRLNAWGVTHNWHQELSRFLLAIHAGLERAEAIHPNDYWRGGTSIPPQGEARELPPAIAPELAEYLNRLHAQTRRLARSGAGSVPLRGAAHDSVLMSRASNSWAVAGDRSASGKPILANDPHMAHFLPSLMFQQHLSAPGMDVIGATIAGVPYVLMGHNGQVAWGMTSSVGDAIDLAVEMVNPENPDQYLTPDGWADFGKREERIRVRKGKRHIETVATIRYTRNGPVINDMYPDVLPAWAPPLAIRWDLSGVYASMAALRKAAVARTAEELRQAVYDVSSPSTSWMVADTEGNISVFATGALPVRRHHLGTFPLPGWLARYEWGERRIAPDELPHIMRKDGVLAHANNLMIEPIYADPLFNVDSAPSYRFDRIIERLNAVDSHTAQSVGDVQTDVLLLRGKRILPLILEDLKAQEGWSPLEKKALALLENWDYVSQPASPETAIFFTTYRKAVMKALADEVDKPAYEFILAQRYSTNVADLWFDDPEHPVWDDLGSQSRQTRRDVVAAAFRDAVKSLRRNQGSDPEAWRWGKLHRMQPAHFFGGSKVVAKFLNLPRHEVGGGLDSVWKSHFDLGCPNRPFDVMAGPVYRMVVDLANPQEAGWVIETGNSGWPGSPHYGDQYGLWLRGDYLPMIQDWARIEETAKATITLR